MSIKNKIKTFFSVDDEYEYIEEEPEVATVETRKERRQQNVVSLKSVQSSSKVVLCEPKSFNEVQEIADQIINRKSVIINLQRAEHGDARQMIDFLSGTIYAVSGQMQKLGSQTFLCTPENVDVSGTISDMLIQEETEKRW
ncbi:cell division protein SepF [Aquibacillus koreensis]|uniref:Cell division protein SepF n=1 Tax=Aquibacillus koreensis TaxID=279446 RepID=A0A9X3WKL9_9BACI|nr:cell division protein SepF [Aquibacillus koreensis]MCT2538045.1 cell division protein SepF [Aquibacillus koreensis]MDC3420568.1 cell division protein SepF [Aquibacillus koreensis]